MTQGAEDDSLLSETESIQEFVRSDGDSLGVDPERGVLRGVKLLGLSSRNGRRYEEAALQKSIGLYEGAKVNVNHPDRDPLAPRDYRDRLGIVRNVRYEAGRGLFGDLHYNPSHSLAEQLAWDAQHAPENVGLSHNVLARTRRNGAGLVVEAITRVQSVDLVADPATTNGLYEQREGIDADKNDLHQQIALLKEQLTRAEAQSQRERRSRRIAELIITHSGACGSDGVLFSEAFRRQLQDAPEEELPTLVEERLLLAQRGPAETKPQSREQAAFGASPPRCDDAAAFVEAVTRRR